MKVHPMTGKLVTDLWPVRDGGSTGMVGSFGWTRDGGKRRHNGVDFLCDPVAPIYAAHDGRIERYGFQIDSEARIVNQGYGIRVWLEGEIDGKKVQTRYAHLMTCTHELKGMEVSAGEVIGLAGRTGNVSLGIETHLHFEVLTPGPGGHWTPVNPLWWLHGSGGHSKYGVPKPGTD